MAANRTAAFKDPLWSTAWLEAALNKEREKYENCPVMPDMVPGYVDAQAWGYVVLGYFLVEESFKALLNIRGKKCPRRIRYRISTSCSVHGTGKFYGNFIRITEPA